MYIFIKTVNGHLDYLNLTADADGATEDFTHALDQWVQTPGAEITEHRRDFYQVEHREDVYRFYLKKQAVHI